MFPERISARICGLSGFFAAVKTTSQDKNLQRAVEQTIVVYLDKAISQIKGNFEEEKFPFPERTPEKTCEQVEQDFVEVDKTTLRSGFLDGMGMPVRVIDVPKTSRQYFVEVVKTIRQVRISERSQVIEVPKISFRESADVVKSIPQERIFERMGKQSRIMEVPKIPRWERVEVVESVSQERSTERRREQSEIITV